MTDKKEFNMTDIGDIASEWKSVNWDLIQRMRFMNADAEIDPEDTFSPKFINKKSKKEK